MSIKIPVRLFTMKVDTPGRTRWPWNGTCDQTPRQIQQGTIAGKDKLDVGEGYMQVGSQCSSKSLVAEDDRSDGIVDGAFGSCPLLAYQTIFDIS